MVGADDGQEVARTVANAAAAWLNDPRDHEAYRRLVAATLRWRDYTQPMLEGTETAGRRDLALLREQPDDAVPVATGRQPSAVGDVLGDIAADPRAVLAKLAGRPASLASTPPEDGTATVEDSPS